MTGYSTRDEVRAEIAMHAVQFRRARSGSPRGRWILGEMMLCPAHKSLCKVSGILSHQCEQPELISSKSGFERAAPLRTANQATVDECCREPCELQTPQPNTQSRTRSSQNKALAGNKRRSLPWDWERSRDGCW